MSGADRARGVGQIDAAGFRLHLLRMARNNLRRRGFSLVFAMIALCIGTFTLGLAMTIIRGAQEQLALQMFATEGYNLVILADPAHADGAETAAAAVSSKTGLRCQATSGSHHGQRA